MENLLKVLQEIEEEELIVEKELNQISIKTKNKKIKSKLNQAITNDIKNTIEQKGYTCTLGTNESFPVVIDILNKNIKDLEKNYIGSSTRLEFFIRIHRQPIIW